MAVEKKVKEAGKLEKLEKKLTYAALLACILTVFAVVSCGSAGTEKEPGVSPTDTVVSSEAPVDVSLSDMSMELGYGITRRIDAVGGREIAWSTSDENIASVDSDGNVKGVDIGECVITAVNEFGRSAQCAVTVKKTCYLSFDDGPLVNVDFMLDALKENDAKATFFLCDTMFLSSVKRMQAEGHALALHTKENNSSHCYRNMFIYYTDLDILNDHIEEYTGARTNLVRFPGGTSNASSDPLTMRRIVNGASDLGYRVFDWTVSAADAKENSTYENSFKIIMNQCFDKEEIILMHFKKFTPKLIRHIVPLLRNRGYVFETLDHYPEHSYTFTCRYSLAHKDVPAESLTLKPDAAELKTGEKLRVNYAFEPEKSTDFIVWESSDESVVKVNKGGDLTAIAPGEAVITAKATSGATAQCRVKVLQAE